MGSLTLELSTITARFPSFNIMKANFGEFWSEIW